jgi:hypothetical protein
MLVKSCPTSKWNTLHTEDDTTIFDVSVTSRRDIVCPILGNQDKMRMGHSVAVDDHSHSFRPEDLSHAPSDSLGRNHDPSGCAIIQVREVIDVPPRNDEAFSSGEWTKGHERHNGIVLKYDARWRLTGRDVAEHAGHASVLR